jgi:hypothetical protein
MSEANSMDCRVGPRAWVIFADNGNCRMWTTFQPHIQKAADAEGLTVTPLFDQAAIDAAVAAERERWLAVVFDGWRVLQGLDEHAQKRTSHQNVSDTLDALWRVMKPNP